MSDKLEGIKLNIAKRHGFNNFLELLYRYSQEIRVGAVEGLIEEIVKTYVNQKLDEASEKACVQEITAYSGTKTINSIEYVNNTASIAGMVKTIRVSKESILSLKEEHNGKLL